MLLGLEQLWGPEVLDGYGIGGIHGGVSESSDGQGLHRALVHS